MGININSERFEVGELAFEEEDQAVVQFLAGERIDDVTKFGKAWDGWFVNERCMEGTSDGSPDFASVGP